MISPANVTACLVTRGDQPAAMSRILDSLIFPLEIVWNNAVDVDWKVAGRYMAAIAAPTELVYFQDDDVYVPPETQAALLDVFLETDVSVVANWAHGTNPDGYDDLPLVGAGAIARPVAAIGAILRYAERYPLDDAFKYEADFVVGALYPSFEHVELDFEIDYAIAQHPSRLANQPWQRALKLELTNRARAIRDRGALPA